MSINIVFMGTPDFAAPCLEALLQEGYNISGVFSQPDRPSGRGKKISYSPVKTLALNHHIPVFQPHRLTDQGVFENLKELNPDLIVVVAYGNLLPKQILDLPSLGCINVHASLLPKLRGAAPIQWSILNGDSTTGITTMYLGEGMDTGDMILKSETPIGNEETAGELFSRLAPMGATLLLETVSLLVAGTAPRIPQNHDHATYAPIMSKEMGEIDFYQTAEKISNWVRGLSPWPSAYTFYKEERVVFHKVQVVSGSGKPGEILDPRELVVACGENAVKILEIQPQGKKTMDSVSFSNGRRVKLGEKFISSSYPV